MSVTRKKWIISHYDSQSQLKLSQELNISPVLAQLCMNRGMKDAAAIQNFIQISPAEIHDPFRFKDMSRAVALIEEAIHQQEKILIYGDYDVDGITATSLLYLYLKSKTVHVAYYIPDRMEEGYGLNDQAVSWAHREGYQLIITVDCGISAGQETEKAHSLGMKVIITDHHTPPEQLPRAEAIINPKIRSDGYPYPDLAGVGVAWKLAQALEIHAGGAQEKNKPVLEAYLDLVALGTIADVVPLMGENRVMVSMGLKAITASHRPGIKALLAVTGLQHKMVSSGQVGFILAPRLNAVGRLSQGSLAVKLLTGTEYEACLSQAHQLEEMNTQRQEVEGEILQQALKMIEETVDLEKDFVIVLAAENWHPGVIGIVSSRLAEKFYRPVVLFAVEGETAKGSARSIDGLDIYLAFSQCRDFLIQFGGHKMAAGVKIKTENLNAFREALNRYISGVIGRDSLVPSVRIDLELGANGREKVYIEDIEKLSPYGPGNAQPVFVYRDLRVIEAKAVGNMQSHLKMVFASDQYILEGIGFNLSHHLSWLNTYGKVDVVVTLEKNHWNGWEKVQLVIRDIQPHEGTLRSLAEPKRYSPTGQKVDRNSFADYREIENRENYLCSLLKKEEPCLIYVSSKEQAARLIKLISGSGLREGKVDWCHGYQRPWQHEFMMAKIKNRLVNTLFFTGQLYADPAGLFPHIVFFHCPRNMDEFLRVTGVGRGQKSPQIHLLFNKEDLETLNQDVHTDFPDRELLGKIYKSVKNLAAPANQVLGTREEILRKIRVDGLDKGKGKAFDAWVSIMMELGLIRITVQGNRPCLELINNGDKCNLEDSFCYAQGLREKKAWEYWMGIAFSPHLNEEICAFLG